MFGSVPVGEYTLVPFYQGEHITFDVAPAKLAFSVGHDSVVLQVRIWQCKLVVQFNPYEFRNATPFSLVFIK